MQFRMAGIRIGINGEGTFEASVERVTVCRYQYCLPFQMQYVLNVCFCECERAVHANGPEVSSSPRSIGGGSAIPIIRQRAMLDQMEGPCSRQRRQGVESHQSEYHQADA